MLRTQIKGAIVKKVGRPTRQQSFFRAIEKGRGRTFINSILRKRRDVNALWNDGHTALSNAAQYGNLEIVKYLVQKGANINAQDFDESIPLHNAARFGHLDIVEYLCGRNCDLNVQDYNEYTPVLLAAEYEHEEIVEFLMRSGADVELCNINEFTVLHFACSNGWLSVVEYHVNNKYNLNPKNSGRMTPMLNAGENHDEVIMSALIKGGADVQPKGGFFEYTALHYACNDGWESVVRDLINEGADPNAVSRFGETPLHVARKWIGEIDEMNIIKFLVIAGADWNLKDGNNVSVFDEFVRIGKFDEECIRFFITYGAYFEMSCYRCIYNNVWLKHLAVDIDLCTQSVMNEFNNKDLPAFYKLPGCSERLPPIENLKILPKHDVAREIRESLERDIITNGFVTSRPTTLKVLSVRALIDHC